MIVRDSGEALHLGIGERGGDQQNGVGAMGARFDDLVLVDREVLAQAGKRDGFRCDLEVAQSALKIRLVGEYGKRRRAAGRIARGEPRNIEFGADQPFGGRGFLDFGDDGRAGLGFSAQSRGPAARLMAPPRAAPSSATGTRSFARATVARVVARIVSSWVGMG